MILEICTRQKRNTIKKERNRSDARQSPILVKNIFTSKKLMHLRACCKPQNSSVRGRKFQFRKFVSEVGPIQLINIIGNLRIYNQLHTQSAKSLQINWQHPAKVIFMIEGKVLPKTEHRQLLTLPIDTSFSTPPYKNPSIIFIQKYITYRYNAQ